MTPIYEAAHVSDAHLVKSLLEQAGIPAWIRGEHLQGALGEVPVTGQIQVCVTEADAARAREIVLDWEKAVPVPDDDPDGTAGRDARAAAGSGGLRGAGIFALGLAFGAGGLYAFTLTPSSEYIVSHRDDGVIDERHTYAGDRIRRVEIDRNRDGRVDLVHRYDLHGRPMRDEYDDDFDGRFETIVTYRRELWHEMRTDDDGDGNIDYLAEATAGVLFRETWFDVQGRPVKRIVYEGGIPVHGEFDSDGDGVLDTRRVYDARGEIVESAPLDPR